MSLRRLPAQSVVCDAVKCDRLSPLTLDELFAPAPSSLAQSESPSFLVAGLDPMLAFYSPAAEPFTLASAVSVAGQLGTMVASAVTSKVFGFAKSWFGARGADKAGSAVSTQQAAAAAAQAKKQRRTAPTPLPMPVIDLPVNRALRDATRTLTRISVDPISGHYACCADSLGRVVLLESESLLAVRMWKGYREARTAWIVQANTQAATPPLAEQQHDDAAKSAQPPLSLYLLLYAPRRGLLELWAVPQGRRSARHSHTLSDVLRHSWRATDTLKATPAHHTALLRCVALCRVVLSVSKCGRSVGRLRLCAAAASDGLHSAAVGRCGGGYGLASSGRSEPHWRHAPCGRGGAHRRDGGGGRMRTHAAETAAHLLH